jgi:hypothetical protein
MSLAAIIIETRPLNDLHITIDCHRKFLPPDTDIFLYGSKENKHIAEKLNIEFELDPKIQKKQFSISDYNNLLTSEYFWEKFTGYDRVLIFQHDSGLLREGIEEFFKWDYVGAPWPFQQHGGNGGLSLRCPLAMLICIHDELDGYNEVVHGNEDVFFSNKLLEIGMKLAPRDVCSEFSVESIRYYGSLGYHAIDKYHSEEIVKSILTQYD